MYLYRYCIVKKSCLNVIVVVTMSNYRNRKGKKKEAPRHQESNSSISFSFLLHFVQKHSLLSGYTRVFSQTFNIAKVLRRKCNKPLRVTRANLIYLAYYPSKSWATGTNFFYSPADWWLLVPLHSIRKLVEKF